MPGREAIFAALFAKLAAVPGLVTTSRELRHWDDVPASEQPALFLVQGDQAAAVPARPTGGATYVGPTEWTLAADVHLYVHRASLSTDALLATAVNTLLDAIEAACAAPAGTHEQTLGGVVRSCRIDGTIETDGGVLGDQAVAVIPFVLIPR